MKGVKDKVFTNELDLDENVLKRHDSYSNYSEIA